MRRGALLALPIGCLAWLALRAAGAGDPPVFRDVTEAAGISFRHHAAPEKKYIVESMSGGVALFDYDNDGRTDIYLLDSLTVDTAGEPNAAHSALYRNLGDGRFQDVADAAGLAHPGWAMGVCTADVDGDGWEDVYVTALGGSHLYRNDHGRFSDVTGSAGVAVPGWSTGCGFADYDHDGDLDLFVSRYVKIDLQHLPQFGKDKTCQYRGVAVQCGPRGLPGESDFLFRNEGGWRFSDVSEAAGVSDPRTYYGLGVAWLDFDQDGWLDLFVANDSSPNYLYRNLGDGRFKDVAFPAGVAVSEDGAEQGCMGVAVGDYDNSGRLALFVTNFSEEYNALYRSEGDHFSDVSFRAGLGAVSLPFVGWGTAFLDYDDDGLLDLVAVNGHVYPQLDQARLGASAPYRQRKLLFHGAGGGRFEEVAASQGEAFTQPRVSRGLAVGDLDDDGRPDLVVNDLDGSPQLLHNELQPTGNWLLVKLRGRPPNTDAVGALVTLRAGGRQQVSLVRSGSSYISQDDMRRHFGLGSATRAELEVRWPDGRSQRLPDVKANQLLELAEPAPEPSPTLSQSR